MGDLILWLVIVILVVCVAIWALRSIAGALGAPPIIVVVGQVLIVVLGLIWILQFVPGISFGGLD